MSIAIPRGWRRAVGRAIPALHVLLLTHALVTIHPRNAVAADAERGRELFAIAGGCGCHTPENGPVGSGGGAVPTPFGTYFGTNITSDAEFGIGAWTDAEIIAALRRGDARGGGVLAPTMPYYRYAGMSDADAQDLVAYLRLLPASQRPNQKADRQPPLARVGYRVWRALFVRPRNPPQVAPRSGAPRGRYLVESVAICGDCHTPRGPLGVPIRSCELHGGPMQGIGRVPDLSAARLQADKWDAADVLSVLTTGTKPDFDNIQGKMAELIDGHGGGLGYKHANRSDLDAIAAFLLAPSAD